MLQYSQHCSIQKDGLTQYMSVLLMVQIDVKILEKTLIITITLQERNIKSALRFHMRVICRLKIFKFY